MSDPTRRVFFALWPDAVVREAIVRQRGRLNPPGARRVPDHNLHLTLLFLGDQPSEAVDAVLGWQSPELQNFRLTLDRFGWFAGARVAWLGGPRHAAGEGLVAALSERAAGQGLRFDRRRWVPHVTLFRRVARRQSAPDPTPVDWPVTEFALIESLPNQGYQVLRTWSLESKADPKQS